MAHSILYKMYILYIGRDRDTPSEFCPGSLVCMTIAEKLDIDITIQDCSILRSSQPFPDWLNGTPILIDRNEPIPIRGTEAVRALQTLLREQERMVSREEQSEDKSVRNREPRRQTQGNVPRMQAQTTRQPSVKPGVKSTPPQPRMPPQDYIETPDAHSLDDDDEPLDAMANGSSQGNNAEISNNKVTEQDLQRYMEARNASVASQAPPPPPPMST